MTDECDRARHAQRVERVQQVRCVVLEHGRRAGRRLGPVGVRAFEIGMCGIRTCGSARVLDIKAFGVKVPGAKSLVGETFDDDDAMGGRQALRDRRPVPHERRDAGGTGERGPVACVENARRAPGHADHREARRETAQQGRPRMTRDAQRCPARRVDAAITVAAHHVRTATRSRRRVET